MGRWNWQDDDIINHREQSLVADQDDKVDLNMNVDGIMPASLRTFIKTVSNLRRTISKERISIRFTARKIKVPW
jgi:hypothetical protein